MSKVIFKQLDPEKADDLGWYFEDEGLYGQDLKNGIIIAGNSRCSNLYYVESFIEQELKEEFDIYYSCNRDDIAEFLSKKTGKEYVWTSISGCCQSDWNIIYYPKEEFTNEHIAEIEAFYFGMYDEYVKLEEEDDLYDYSVFIPYYVRDKKQYIAEWTGYETKDITLREFKGYEKIPIYEEV